MGQSCGCMRPRYGHENRPRNHDILNGYPASNRDSETEPLELIIDVQNLIKNDQHPKLKIDSLKSSNEEEDDLQKAIALSLTSAYEQSIKSTQVNTTFTAQKQTAFVVSDNHLNKKIRYELECIMCLDTFNNDDPKIRTLCKCGINRTNFHLNCLLEWINRDENCPVCREHLYYEETDMS